MSAPFQFSFSSEEGVLAQFTLDPGEYVIGRDESCQVVIDIEGMLPKHARLRVADQVEVEDLQSSTGTFLAGRRLHERAAMRRGETVRFGLCPGELRLEPAEESSEAESEPIAIAAPAIQADAPQSAVLEPTAPEPETPHPATPEPEAAPLPSPVLPALPLPETVAVLPPTIAPTPATLLPVPIPDEPAPIEPNLPDSQPVDAPDHPPEPLLELAKASAPLLAGPNGHAAPPATAPAARSQRRRRKLRASSPPPELEPEPAEDANHGHGWEAWTTPLPPAESTVTAVLDPPAPPAPAISETAREAPAAAPSLDPRIPELEAELTRLREEVLELSDAAEKARAERDNASLLKVANRALVKKLSQATGPSDERVVLRKELKQREKALVEAWAGRQAADERNGTLTRQLERLQNGRQETAAASLIYLPAWLAWSFVASLLGLLALGYVSQSSVRRARQAESVVARIRSTAPQFYKEARALVLEGEFLQATSKIDCALALNPEHPDYFFLKGCIAESMLQLPAAIAAFERTLGLAPKNLEALKNLELCRTLQQNRRGGQAAESQYALHQLMLESGRLPEALRMAQRLNTDSALLYRTWSAILEAAGLRAQLTLNEDDATFDLDLQAQSRVELSLLRGLPLRKLTLARSNITDLTPLRGASIRFLNLSGNPVRDLSPLTGMPLEALNLANTEATNLYPLNGLPLTELNLEHTPVSDLSPLRGMRLQSLHAASTAVWNLQPLAESPLRVLDLAHTRVSDLEPLRHLPLKELNVEGTPVADLQPLEGAPLAILNAARTPIRSLAPLQKAPLRELLVGGCTQLSGVEPLAGTVDLERMTLPPHLKQLATLRKLPRLRFLTYEGDTAATTEATTAQQFWQTYAGN